MIVNFTVSNFGSIKESQTLSFEASKSDDLEEYYIIEPIPGLRLLKLAYIYGPNASGKTTILKALDFLQNLVSEPLDKKSSTFDFKPFLLDNNYREKNTFFSLEFVQNDVKYLYELELNKKAIVSEKLFFHQPSKALVFSRNTNLDKQLTNIEFGGKIKIKKENVHALAANTLWNNTVLGGYSKTNFESKELKDVYNWFCSIFMPIIRPKSDLLDFIYDRIEGSESNKENLIKILNKADFKISDITVKNELHEIEGNHLDEIIKIRPHHDADTEKVKVRGTFETKETYFQHTVIKDNLTESYELNYHDESEGTQRYYQFSGLLEIMIKQKFIISIDEIESSLHPDLLKHFLLTFLVNSKHSQLIATSHYRELLMEKDILRKDAIWFTEKQADGSTDLFSLDDFDSSVIRDTSSIYNAYKIGKLGAVPNLGDYYLNLADGKE